LERGRETLVDAPETVPGRKPPQKEE